ncbi:helix-turn-helix domain-containing protein [Nocardia sp. NPDC004260]
MGEDKMATSAEVAKFLRTTTARLANDRYHGRGIPYVKFGASVRYRWRDVHDWIEQNTERPGAA